MPGKDTAGWTDGHPRQRTRPRPRPRHPTPILLLRCSTTAVTEIRKISNNKRSASVQQPKETMESQDIYWEDGSLLGSPEILLSPNVVEAPSRVNHPVPVPSIYQDERGSIHNFQIGGRRLNLLHTRAGVMRSGDIHKVNQHDFVFSGQVEVLTLRNDGTNEKKIYQENQYICIPPYTPHIFHFKKDTVLAEWWDGPFHAWLYKPYRVLVEKSFRATKPGRFDHYLVSSQGRDSAFLSAASHPFLWTGAIIGLALGFVFGRRS